jgi:nucleoside diphosphate kinase
MSDIAHALGVGNSALAVFSPDAVQSRLVGNLEAYIREQIDLEPVARYWVRHSPGSIERFYADSVSRNVPHWHLVAELFCQAPSLVVVFSGAEAPEKLLRLKGKAHPAEAAEGTIRSRFWCDNAVCNLIHVSDQPDTAEAEYRILDALRAGQAALEPRMCPRWPINTAPTATLSHNGSLLFAHAVAGALIAEGQTVPDMAFLGPNDGAWENHRKLIRFLTEIKASGAVKTAIEAFLLGIDESNALDALPLTTWDRLVIKASMFGQKRWSKAPFDMAIKNVRAVLSGLKTGWIISGSAAMRINGIDVSPNDIDIWCVSDSLREISRIVRQNIEHVKIGEFSAERVSWNAQGWNVEAIGPLSNSSRTAVGVDEAMVQRAQDRVEAAEDLIAELLVLRRKEKNDVARAVDYITYFGDKLDLRYLRWRLAGWNATADLIEALVHRADQ